MSIELIFLLRSDCAPCKHFKIYYIENHIESLTASGYKVRYTDDPGSIPEMKGYNYYFTPGLLMIYDKEFSDRTERRTSLFNPIDTSARKDISKLFEIQNWISDELSSV